MKNTTIIDYRGVIQYETIGELIHKFKNQIHTLGAQISTYKRILLVMIESLENIMKYSELPPDKIPNDTLFLPVFSIIKSENHFTIIASNPIKAQVVTSLKDKLEHINSLDQQGLKDLYKETITNGEFSNRGGAGLGLIELSKISGNLIKYEFKPIDKNYARFTQWITIEASRG